MYNVPELVSFILDRQYDDFKQMREFINDDINNLNINSQDIYFLEGCAAFIYKLQEELQKECTNFSEKLVLDKFINTVNTFKDLSIKFEKSSEKYNSFNDLNTYHLNTNELKIDLIKRIVNLSLCEINYNGTFYTC
ncbi:hypothetical protein BCR36DRAFT_241269, partial [Piromyces finnis]